MAKADEHNFNTIQRSKSGYYFVDTLEKLANFYPLTSKDIQERSEYVQKIISQELNVYLKNDPKQIIKEQALYTLDALMTYVNMVWDQCNTISMVHPDQTVIATASKEMEVLNKLRVDLFSLNRDVYLFLKIYLHEGKDIQSLTAAERYFLDELIAGYEKNGLNLPEEKRTHIKNLKKEIDEIVKNFEHAIAQDSTTLNVTAEELQGVPEDFLATLKKDDAGLYILDIDYPTQSMIMQECEVEATRKKFYEAKENKAYPVNDQNLKLLVSKRHELAQLLGFKNFAHYDLSDQMAQNPENVQHVCKEIKPFVQKKMKAEIDAWVHELSNITKTEDGKINAWDVAYILNNYQKKHYQFDELVMAEYFPLRETMQGLFKIYEQFFSITLQEVTVEKKWHEDVSVIKVSRDKVLLGYIFLDLHPREKKFSHAAVVLGKITHKLLDETICPGVCLLVCNFTKPTATKQALLRYDEVTTFFHEFGHALHSTLGITYLATQAGFQVKSDFVELPSQILEMWLEDKAILKSLGKHYKTGQLLPDDLIDKKLALLTLSNGYFEARQSLYTEISLALFEKELHADMSQLMYELKCNLLPNIYNEKTQELCSFGHLGEYAAKYYGYLWTRIFACDVFDQIEKEGLLNPQAGKKYLDLLIAPGGSKDPNQMLVDYLGRKPNNKAFLKRNKFN